MANVDWFVISHRLCIAREASKQGWDVFVACEDTGRKNEIEVDGITFVDFKFSRSGMNPLNEIITLSKFLKLYKEINPDVVHHVTLKPVTYGTLVGKFLKVKGILNAVSGLGYNFTGDRKGVVQTLMIKLMRFGFNRRNVTFIFQNEDDQKALDELKITTIKNKVERIKGSGVDLDIFSESEFPSFD